MKNRIPRKGLSIYTFLVIFGIFFIPSLFNKSFAQAKPSASPYTTLLQEADFVCLILPLTEETHHLFGEAQFARMKSSAIFINAGRGPVVDEKALIAALQEGKIHAAGLDVFEQEPLAKDSPLLTMPNVVALPHIGSATHETRYNMAAAAWAIWAR